MFLRDIRTYCKDTTKKYDDNIDEARDDKNDDKEMS